MTKTPQIPALPGMTPLGICTTKTVAVWTSKGAKYWLHLKKTATPNGVTWSLSHEHGGSYLGHVSVEDAFAAAERELSSYEFD